MKAGGSRRARAHRLGQDLIFVAELSEAIICLGDMYEHEGARHRTWCPSSRSTDAVGARGGPRERR